MFIGREREVAALDRLYESNKFEFAVIYGRRRVGKLNENINKCLDNGLDVIREEAIRQINEFLANKNK